jgi:tetratricopeptide (TPR) repeat protein
LFGICMSTSGDVDTRPNGGITGAIEESLKGAEQALQDQELQLAESLYRDALRDSWLLEASLRTLAGDSEGAQDAREAARRSAVTPGDEVPASALADLAEAEQSELGALLAATRAAIYRNLGILAEGSRRPQQAAEHFARAEALEPPGGVDSLGLATVDLRQSPPSADLVVGGPGPDENEEQLAAAIAETPGAALTENKAAAQEVSHLHQRLARIYLARGDDQKAAAELRTAADLGSLDLDLGLKLADLEAAARNGAAARRELRVLTTTHTSPRALVLLAELTWSTGPANSLPILLEARALAPNSEEILGHVANAQLAADEPAQALEPLGPLLVLSPEVVPYLRLLGEAYTKLGRLDEAVEVLRRILVLEPDDLRSRLHLAGVLLQGKRFDEAEAVLGEILAIDPERPEAKDLLEYLETVREQAH